MLGGELGFHSEYNRELLVHLVAHYTQERKKYEDLVVKGSVKPLHSLQSIKSLYAYEMQSSSGRDSVTEDDVPEILTDSH